MRSPTVAQVVSSVESTVLPSFCSTAGTFLDIFVSFCGSRGIERYNDCVGYKLLYCWHRGRLTRVLSLWLKWYPALNRQCCLHFVALLLAQGARHICLVLSLKWYRGLQRLFAGLQIALLLAPEGTTYLCYPTVDQVVSSVASIVFNTICSTAGTVIDIFVSSHCGSSGIERCLESLGHNF